jgi:hypothetical protein
LPGLLAQVRADGVLVADERFPGHGVTAVITGPRTLSQMRDNLAGFSLTLPSDALARLSDISRPASSEPVTGMGARR